MDGSWTEVYKTMNELENFLRIVKYKNTLKNYPETVKVLWLRDTYYSSIWETWPALLTGSTVHFLYAVGWLKKR